MGASGAVIAGLGGDRCGARLSASVCVMPTDFDGCGHYRLIFPMRELARHGAKVTMPRYGVNEREDGFKTFMHDIDRTGVPDCDTYVMQNPNGPAIVEIMLSLRRAGRRVIFETDDLHENLPRWHPASKKDFRWFHAAVKIADQVTVSTPALAEVYGQLNENVVVIPNQLDWSMWEDVTPAYEIDRPLRIGWMGSAKIRWGDIDALRGVLGPFLRNHPDVLCVHSGNGNFHDHVGTPPEQRVSFPGFAFHKMLLPRLLDFDIGLIPLDAHLFSDAKSDLKGMEYAAAGIPCIASPSRPYRDWVEPGANGFLARKPREWREALEALVTDDALRRQMGRAAREKAKTRTVQENWRGWDEAWQTNAADRMAVAA